MDTESTDLPQLYPDDSISELQLNTRTHNALCRSSIKTIGALLESLETGRITSVRNFGEKSLQDVNEKLSQFEIVEINNVPTEVPASEHKEIQGSILQEETSPESQEEIREYIEKETRRAVLDWQRQYIFALQAREILHPEAIINGEPIAHWLLVREQSNTADVSNVYSRILHSFTIYQELNHLLQDIDSRNISILLLRHGMYPKTLEEIGTQIGVTRERVRQICNEIERQITSRAHKALHDRGLSEDYPTLIKFQSSLLLGKQMQYNVSHESWKRRLTISGLIGSQIPQTLEGFDPFNLITSISNLLGNNIPELTLPDNLKYAHRLAVDGYPTLPAKVALIHAKLPYAVKKLIRRHERFSGGVSAKWLASELSITLEQAKETLQALHFVEVYDNWFTLRATPKTLTNFDVFHHSLRKMFLFCGPLPIDDICSGIRHTISRSNFPTPPAEIMAKILTLKGYKYENNLYCWEGEVEEELSRGEQVIFKCIQENGLVVHHSELTQAFIDSELSFPSLHATLTRTALFTKIDTGLYKQRGVPVTYEDIERAKETAERTPVDLEVQFDRRGFIAVSVTLGILAIGTGEVFSEQLPNLVGEWACTAQGIQFRPLKITEKYIKRLREPLETLGCEVGDRITLWFNTWEHSVTIEKAELNEY